MSEAGIVYTAYSFECLSCGRDTRVSVDALEAFREMERKNAALEGAPVPADWPGDEYLVSMFEACVECATGTEQPGEHDARWDHLDIREARRAYREAQAALVRAQDQLRERRALYVMTLGNHLEAHGRALAVPSFDIPSLNSAHGTAHKQEAAGRIVRDPSVPAGYRIEHEEAGQ